MQGKKTHEQQLRILERKSDVPDARQTAASMNRTGRDARVHLLNGMPGRANYP